MENSELSRLILNLVFSKYHISLDDTVNEFIIKNNKLNSVKAESFMYENITYCFSPATDLYHTCSFLHLSLHKEFKSVHQVYTSLLKDKVKVKACLSSLITRSKSKQDLYNLLPQIIHTWSSDDLKLIFKGVTRTVSEENIFKNDISLITIRNNGIKLIEKYIGYQLLL